ncbi:MAG TPA: hypothetical protein PLO23_04215 [Alphaproteobacteria bacterium]|nr:hypothetical protein [Alphaproteobacteria bacterium]
MHLNKPAECHVSVEYKDGPMNKLYVLDFNGHAGEMPNHQTQAVISSRALLKAGIDPRTVHQDTLLQVTDVEDNPSDPAHMHITGIAVPELSGE